MPLSFKTQTWPVLARSSPLSRVQVDEVLAELRSHYPEAAFEPTFLETGGDLDQKTSLRDLDKTDFFTREIDQLLLNGHSRIAIHSAKDLPHPLPSDLQVFAFTKGVDSSDSLVLQEGQTLEGLPPGSLIATSSLAREARVRELRSDLAFCDIRGAIGERLAVLDEGKIAGVVIAEAALIRLGLTHLNRLTLPGASTPMQGRLAIVGREKDEEARDFFACLNAE